MSPQICADGGERQSECGASSTQTTHGDRRVHPLDVGLFDEYLSRLEAQLLHLRLGYVFASSELLYLPAWPWDGLVNTLLAGSCDAGLTCRGRSTSSRRSLGAVAAAELWGEVLGRCKGAILKVALAF